MLQGAYPGLVIADGGNESRIVIPDRYHVSHEAHFARVTKQFFQYVKNPATMPAWEKRLSDEDIRRIIAHIRTF